MLNVDLDATPLWVEADSITNCMSRLTEMPMQDYLQLLLQHHVIVQYLPQQLLHGVGR